MKKVINLAVLSAIMFTAGCYGSFSLTRKLWKWNGDVVKEQWGREAIFLGLNIIPVYAVAGIVDGIILNSVEFWGGENPVTAKASRTVTEGDQAAVMNWMPAENRLRIDIFENNKPKGWVLMAKDTTGNLYATDSNGARLNSRINPDNTITLYGAEGNTVATYKPEDVNKYLN